MRGLSREATRVINLMNEKGMKWSPGKQRGRPVRIAFTMPIKFKLVTTPELNTLVDHSIKSMAKLNQL